MESRFLISPVPGLDPEPFGKDSLVLEPEQVRELDSFAINTIGIPGPVLMENASSSVARIISTFFSPNTKIVIVAGVGNNGGDGMALHRHIHPRSRLVLTTTPDKLKGDALLQWSILEKAKIEKEVIKDSTEIEKILSQLEDKDLIVDAIFGTGLTREVGGIYKEIIEIINNSKAKVLAVDLPSGLNAKSGEILGVCTKANYTVTFAAIKKGMTINKGPEMCGKIFLAGIGIPKAAMKQFLEFYY